MKLLNWLKRLKIYYNSKLIEQLADNIKTKFIWFLWRKQVVKLTRPPIQQFNFDLISALWEWAESIKMNADGHWAAASGLSIHLWIEWSAARAASQPSTTINHQSN